MKIKILFNNAKKSFNQERAQDLQKVVRLYNHIFSSLYLLLVKFEIFTRQMRLMHDEDHDVNGVAYLSSAL